MSKSTFVPNSFQTPNGYVDLVMPYLTGEEYKVLSYATRRILGFQKRQDRIALSQFTDGTKSKDGEVLDRGTGLSVGTVKDCLKSLVGFGLMMKLDDNDPKTNEGNLWGLQWDATKVNWQALEERYNKKQEADRRRIAKARSMRQTQVVPQTPGSGTEPTPGSPTDPPPTSGTETQKTDEIQGNPVAVLSPEEIARANRFVEGMLELSQSPGLKREARIDSILSYLGGKLHINAETKRWKTFAKWVDERQQIHKEKVDVFVTWLTSQKNFDIQFWPPSKMQEMWPQAFMVIEPEQSTSYPRAHKL
jgi:hypothetical protein